MYYNHYIYYYNQIIIKIMYYIQFIIKIMYYNH